MIRKFIPKRTRIASLTLALVVLLSAVGTPALAATETATETYSGPTEKTFTTGPHKVEIDLSDVTTETTISVITSESPAGDNATIMKKTVSGTTTSAHFRNAGAYETFNVRVEGADAEPSMSKGGVTDAWVAGSSGKFLGDTGGDAGFTYDLSEQLGEALNPQIVQLDRTPLPGTTTTDLSGLDAQSAKLEIYQDMQNSKSANDIVHDTMSNQLQDAQTTARIKGKNAYIRALNNGDSKSAAKTQAKQAVEDYYATHQMQLAAAYERAVLDAGQAESQLSTNSNTDPAFVRDYDASVTSTHSDDGNDEVKLQGHDTGSASVTLVNGSSASVPTIQFYVFNAYNDASATVDKQALTGPVDVTDSDGATSTFEGSVVKSHDGTAPSVTYIDYQKFGSSWSTIQSQTTTVKGEMDTLAENTYSAYQNGEINNSDLVDPYVLANQQSAGDDFQGWAAAQLTLLGTNSPENFDQIGSFNVTASDGTQYEGVLFSQENPASGQFAAGNTYNASTLGGTQYIVTSDSVVELTGEFTVDDITSQDGETVKNVTIKKTQYKTTNTTELTQLYEDLAERRAEIEAREQNLKNSGGGVLFGGSNSMGIILLGGVALILIASRGDD